MASITHSLKIFDIDTVPSQMTNSDGVHKSASSVCINPDLSGLLAPPKGRNGSRRMRSAETRAVRSFRHQLCYKFPTVSQIDSQFSS